MALSETARLIASLELQDKFSKPIGQAQKSLGGFEKSLGRIGKGVGQVGSGLDKLGTRIAVGAAAGLTAVVTTAASFEQAFTGVEKTVDGTDAQLKELEETIRQMARTIPVSFEELSAIGEAGGALGIARDSLDEFIDVVARLSVSTNLTSDQAATALGQLGTILHLTGSDFEDFADSLVALGNAGASTEDQIIDLAARFAAAGNSAGLSKEEILALASATASMGIDVEAGGTALSQTFNNIATGIGTGSKEIKAFTDLLGISAAEFKKRWTEDALGTFQDFLGELAKLDQFEQADILESAGITGQRQLSAIKLMTQNVGFLEEQLQVAENATGALDKESQKFFDTSVGQWKVLVNNVRDAAATIGTELLPVANELITEFVDKLQEPGSQAGLKKFAEDLASGVKGLVAELKGTDFSGIIDGMKLAAQVAKGAFDAFRALPAPIQQLAIAALIANKVSGGAVGQIAKGLVNIGAGALGMRGATPANPLFVTQVGGGLGGAPVAGGGSLLGTVAKFVIGPAAAVIIGSEIAAALNNPKIQPAIDFEQNQLKAVVDSQDLDRIVDGLNAIEAEQNTDDILAQTALIASNIPFIGDALGHVGPQLEKDRQVLLDQLEQMGLTREQAEQIVAEQKALTEKYGTEATKQINAVNALNIPLGLGNVFAQQIKDKAEATIQKNAAILDSLRGQAGSLIRIAEKNFSPTVRVNVQATSYLSLRTVSGALTSYRISAGGLTGGFTESAESIY